MGLLSKIVKSPFGTIMNTVSTAFTHPIKVAEAILSPNITVKEVVAAHTSQTIKQQTTETILSTIGYATAITGISSIATKGIAALIPSTIKGKVAAAVATPIVVGSVISSPSVLTKAAAAPVELAKFGGDVGTFISDPSVSTFVDVIKESPIISAGIAAVGLGSLGAVTAGVVGGVLNRNAIETQTENIVGAINEKKESGTISMGGGSQNPILPQTTKITASKTRSKRRTAKKIQPVRQSVTVNVNNKRYINQRSICK